MLPTDIMQRAARLLEGAPLNMPDVKDWLNEALEAIGKDCWQIATTTFVNAVNNTWYALPTDFIDVFEIFDQWGNKRHRHYEVAGPNIKFWSDGQVTYTLNYFQMPTTIVGDTDAIPCHVMIHPLLPFYIAYRYLDKSGDQQGAAAKLAEYEAKLGLVLRTQLAGKRNRRVHVPRWR